MSNIFRELITPGRLRILVALIVVVAIAERLRAAEDQKPNIVFVLIDDLRFDDLGCTGNPFVHTPNIDRVASEGAIFRNAFQ